MKIIVDNPKCGKFEWELPQELVDMYKELGSIYRGPFNLSEDDASLGDQAWIDQMEGFVRTFLHLLTGVHMVGGPQGLAIQELFKEEVGNLAQLMLSCMKEMK